MLLPLSLLYLRERRTVFTQSPGEAPLLRLQEVLPPLLISEETLYIRPKEGASVSVPQTLSLLCPWGTRSIPLH